MQYIVMDSDINKRKDFYNYIHNNFEVYDAHYDKNYMIESHFPFVIDFKEKYLMVLESITCCACAAQNKKIISIEEFKERI